MAETLVSRLPATVCCSSTRLVGGVVERVVGAAGGWCGASCWVLREQPALCGWGFFGAGRGLDGIPSDGWFGLVLWVGSVWVVC